MGKTGTFKVLFALCAFIFQINVALGQKKPSFQLLRDGLSNYHIKCIFQDSKGFMWFGTYDGLNKYDGSRFVKYENSPSDTNSLCYNYITAIVEDKHKNIWVGTSNGISVYNREKDNFTMLKPLRKFNFTYISTLFFDQYDKLWIGTSGDGLYIFDTKTQKLKPYPKQDPPSNKTVCSNFVNKIVRDCKNRIWIGSRNGLSLYDYKSNTFTHFRHNDNDPASLSHNSINSLKLDKEDNLWIGVYGGGVNRLIEKNGKISFRHYLRDNSPQSLSNNNILSLCPDRRGNLWVGTENGGLNYLNIATGEVEHYFAEDDNQKALVSNSIWEVYEDRDGIIWIGSYNKGINIIDQNYDKFELYQKNYSSNQKLVNNDIKDFALDQSGKVWIATDGGGICGFDPGSRKFFDFKGNSRLSANTVMSLLIDSKGNLWAGTWAMGLDKFDKNGNKLKNYTCSNWSSYRGNISCLFQDKKGNIFVGTSGSGLFLYQSQKDIFTPISYTGPYDSHLNTNSFISHISEDSQNNIWVGTYHGLIRLSPDKLGAYSFTQYFHDSTATSLSSSRIKVVFEDSRKRIWVGTERGLDLITDLKGIFAHYTRQDGLPNSSVNSIVEDAKGNLWLSTNFGLSKFTPSNATFKNFTRDDGLSSNEFCVGASLKTQKGDLLFGGSNGFNMFSPDSIKFNSRVPLVYITDLKISNMPVKIGGDKSPLQRSISETNEITLTHKQSSFALEFVAINYTRSAQNQYKYMLEGFDKKWVNSGTQHNATYTNLDAGTYTFKVMGANNDGLWNPKPTILKIKVLPPFWASVWAYILYFLIFATLLYSFLKLWMIKTEQAQRLKYEKIQRGHEEELNKLKIQFFTNISHELRTPLTLIVTPLEHLVSSEGVAGKIKQQLTLAFKNTERLMRLVNELMDFSKFEENKLKLFVKQSDLVKFARDIYWLFTDESRRKGITYTFEATPDMVVIWVDWNKLEKVFMNLLSNAFKYTPEGGFIKIAVHIPDGSGFVQVQVVNSGPGISAQHIGKIFDRFYQVPDSETNAYSGTGIGLALVKSIIELHQGSISVNSDPNFETCFSFSLQLGNNHFSDADIIHQPEKQSKIRTLGELDKPAPNASGKPLVLVVEDNDELRGYLVSLLNDNYQVVEAADGEIGWGEAVEKNPDLIISDIIMPKLSGTDLCARIKGDLVTSHIPIVLLTSQSSIEDHIEGVESGADAYITKPFNVQHLKATIKSLIETRRKLFQRFSQDIYLLPKEVATNKHDQNFLEQAIEYINSNIENEDISVEGMAAYMTMNRSQVYRKIKALTDQSATEFIRTVRLKMAIKLLEAGEYNISEISYKVGFSSPAYFTKCFREQFGKLPSGFLAKRNSGKESNHL